MFVEKNKISITINIDYQPNEWFKSTIIRKKSFTFLGQ